jgi:sterol desaturase/sphingolipid hydroxylase (fatty acid hydroxylase superfamily)
LDILTFFRVGAWSSQPLGRGHAVLMEVFINRSSGHDGSRLRLFRSPGLERLTVVSAGGFIALWAILLPAIGLIGALNAMTPWAIPLLVGGLIIWTATEYALHRYVFHFEPRSQLLKQIIFVIHGNHHAEPNDPLRNLMPPIVSIPVGALIWVLSIAVFGPSGTWFLLGFMMGYVAYDLVHFACHQFPMKGRIARALKVHHMRHHHLKVGGNYAITGMIWDRIFATRISSVPKG